MATYYVSTSGNNGNAGTFSSPWRNVSYACGAVITPGDIIYINPGSYTESSRCYLRAGVSLQGADRATTIVYLTYAYTGGSPEENGNLQLQSSSPNTNGNQTISGITFDGNNWAAKTAICIWNRGNVKIHHCTIRNFNYHGVTYRGEGYNYDNEIHDCTITDCSSHYLGLGNITLEWTHSLLVYDNILSNTGRPDGYNGDLVNTIPGDNANFKFYRNTCTKTTFEDISGFPVSEQYDRIWNFHLECWNSDGGFEIYENHFINGDCAVDMGSYEASGYGNFRGAYGYSYWIHDNLFEYTVQYPTSDPENNKQILTIEDMSNEYILIERNHFLRIPLALSITCESVDEGPYTEIVVRYNLFEDIGYANGATWTTGACYLRGDGSFIYSNIYFDNNTFIGKNCDAFIMSYFTNTINHLYIRNNIITNCDSAWLDLDDRGAHINFLEVRNNIFFNNANGNAIKDPGGVIAVGTYVETDNQAGVDPEFVSSSDFNLQLGSPAINAGLAIGLTTDYNDFAIVGVPDIGALEYGSSSVIVSPPVTPDIPVTTITVTGEGSNTVINVDNGTLQMYAHIDPHNATDQTVVWSVINGTGSASISATGLLTAISNGTVTVKATSNG